MESWPVFLILGAILSIVLFAKVETPKFIGSLGEHDIAHKLKRLNRQHYTSLSDILIPANHGSTSTSQIDHLVISTYGIFCIETKARSGLIVGDAQSKYWTQTLGRQQHELYNPLWQNHAHIRALEGILRRQLKAPIVSLIAFTMAEKLDVSGSEAVADAKGTIAKLLSYQTPIYSPEEQRVLTQLIEANRLHDRASYRQHVRQVKAHKS